MTVNSMGRAIGLIMMFLFWMAILRMVVGVKGSKLTLMMLGIVIGAVVWVTIAASLLYLV